MSLLVAVLNFVFEIVLLIVFISGFIGIFEWHRRRVVSLLVKNFFWWGLAILVAMFSVRLMIG